MNSLVCLMCAAVAVLAAGGAQAGEAPVQKRGVVGLGYGYGGLHGVGYAGGYGYGHGHGHYGLPVASYGYHGYHAPLAYSKVVVPTVAKVAYPAYSYSAYPYVGYNKLEYAGYPLGYSKLAYSAYPSYAYSKVLSPYHYW